MQQVQGIPGLLLQPNVLTDEVEASIIQELDSLLWSDELRRRTIHRGYRYPYGGGALTKTDPIEGYLLHLANFLAEHRVMGVDNQGSGIRPDQVIVNEYLTDQGIGAHTDRLDFGPVIVAFSLGQDTNFVFRKSGTTEHHEIYVPHGSLMVMSGEARSGWTHEIPKRKTITTPSGKVKKGDDYRRISITYRTIPNLL